MLNNKKFMDVFHSEHDLLKKIVELQALGFTDDDMYIVVKEENDMAMVRARTHIPTQSASMSFGDRFAAFLLGDTPVHDALLRTGLTEEEADAYYTDIQNGGMLLYVDREWTVDKEAAVHIPVERKEIAVERRPAVGNAMTDNVPYGLGNRETVFVRNEAVHVPLAEEKIEATKTPAVTEEMIIKKKKVQHTEAIQTTVRREKAHVHEKNSPAPEK